jgi:hypothetical protein
MNNEPIPPVPSSTPGDALQFDKAEFAQPSVLSCVFCKAPITGEYFQVNNQVACPNCRQQLDAHLGQRGNKLSRAFVAAAAGIAAAVVGWVIYWAILTFLHIEFGLVAILVGWMIGAAVRWGSKHTGGIFYQLMAVALTYFAIASTYTPAILASLEKGHDDTAIEGASKTSTNAPASATAEKKPLVEKREKPPFIALLIAAFALSLAAPFLMGLSNIIGILILGFGLYQAWVMNRKTNVQISGPYSAARPA